MRSLRSHAAEISGSPEWVASALIALQRYHEECGTEPAGVPLRAGMGGASLERRVRLLLDEELDSRRANLASDVLAVCLVGFALALVFSLLGSDLAHHGAETALGLFAHHH